MPLVRKDPATVLAPAEHNALQQLHAGSADERFAAARSLSGRADAVFALGAALASEGDSRVRAAILTALVRANGPESVSAIVPMIRSEDAAIRTGALDALRLMPSAVEAHLGELLTDIDPDVRLLVCELARDLPAPAASELMCDLLETETQPNVCAAALDVLVEVGGEEALPALAKCRGRLDHIPFISFAIRAAVDRIRAKPVPCG